MSIWIRYCWWAALVPSNRQRYEAGSWRGQAPPACSGSGFWDLARAGWRLVRGLFDPEPLHAATAASLVIDEGLGGLTGGFSHFGWVIPKTFSISAGNSQAVPAGTILPINPRVCYTTTHPQLAAIVGETVTFTITGGGGKLILGGGEAVVDIAQMPTDETGCAEVPWRLGAAASASGLNTLMASVPFAAQRTQAFMATSLPIGIGSASLGGTPATLEIGGHEVFGTVSVNNGTGQSILGLQVRGWVLQGSVRQPAGGSHDPFTCTCFTYLGGIDAQIGKFHLCERLFLRAHDALHGWINSLKGATSNGDDGWQGTFYRLVAALRNTFDHCFGAFDVNLTGKG